ncbi:O-antigen ligase family protein [Flavobacterium aurantiibacter]|uniref:O-antigen ligase-related domain-containing protein n=1 Tax=Flavobacterium aurantiibacter TaxID=2023067 RepID=A0A255ZLP1_9FLAO|nr:O-antigen ligase family protein [Flavobacterium aurantiibacter]OYQ41560.1 hypothetical protein CHX27_12880 [Flavobacterium aurantiibacter]
MKISKSTFYSFLLGFALLSQLYVASFKIAIFLQILVLAIYFVFEKAMISKRLLFSMYPLLVIFLIGFVGFLVSSYSTFNLIKDILHFIKPLLAILIGFLFVKKIGGLKELAHTIVYTGLISSIIHFYIILFVSGFSSVTEVREFSRDNFLELFALFFLVYYKKFNKELLFSSNLKHNLVSCLLFISCLLYFSRTMIVVAIILALTLHGYTIITRKALKGIGFFIIAIALFYTYLFSVKIDRKKPGLESFLYKVKNAPSEIFKTKIDRENHKDLWDHWRGYEAARAFDLMNDHPSSYIFGTGHGSLVNLKFFAPLTENYKDKGIKFISELHNGYVYILYKTGFIGLLAYLLFLWKLYRRVYGERIMTTYFVSGIALAFFFTTLTITGIYNPRDIMAFLLGAFLYFEFNQQPKSL